VFNLAFFAYNLERDLVILALL